MRNGKVLVVLLAAVLLAFLPGVAHAQQWAKTYGGPGFDQAASIRQTADGGYIVAGETDSSGAGDVDVWILKLNGDGTIAWQKSYGGPGFDAATSIQQTADGGYIVAGETDSFGAGDVDVWILKLNGDGSIAWQKAYGGPGLDQAASIQQTADGGYVVAGITDSSGAGLIDAWVLKLDGDGTIAWQNTYGGAFDDRAFSIQPTTGGGYVVAGWTCSFGVGYCDAWVLKLNGDGSIAWQKTYGGPGFDAATSIQQTADGGYIVAGETDSFGAGDVDVWVLKLNGDGSIAWQNTYGGAGRDVLRSVQQTADGGYVVAGFTESFGVDVGAGWVLKLNGDGTIAWQKIYGRGDFGQGEVFSIQPTAGGGYIVAARTFSFGPGVDAWVLKLDANGEMPGCGPALISSATATPTTATVGSSAAAVASSGASPVTSTATPTTSTASGSTACPATGTVAGSFAIGGAPQAGYAVVLKNKLSRAQRVGATDTTGSYQFELVQSGLYRIGFSLRVTITTTVAGTLDVDGSPVASARVKLKSATGTRTKTKTNASGAFTFAGVVAGYYYLVIPKVTVP